MNLAISQILKDRKIVNDDINSILIDLDTIQLSKDELKDIANNFNFVYLSSAKLNIVNQMRILFRLTKNVKTFFISSLSIDVKSGIDLLMSNDLNSFSSFLKFNKNIKFLASTNSVDEQIYGFKSTNFENVLQKDYENISLNNIDLKVKHISTKEVNFSENLKKYKSNTKKIAVYTCILGNYDNLIQLKNADTNNFDYICYTNCNIKPAFPWKIVDISQLKIKMNLDNVMMSRYIKIHPERFQELEDYDISVWINANVDVIGDLNNFVNKLNDENYLLTFAHPIRNTVYEEIDFDVKSKVDDYRNLNRLQKNLISDGFLNRSNLVQTNVLVRRHNENDCINIMNSWWLETIGFTKCDNITLIHSLFKNGGRYMYANWELANKMYFNSNLMHGGMK